MVRLTDTGYFSFEITQNITPADVEALIEVTGKDNKIYCIKAAREKWGLGLKDAKELIETVMKPRRRYLQIWHRDVWATLDNAWNDVPEPPPDGFQLVDVRLMSND